MSINLIVANSVNGVIGKNGNMPWHIPQDLKRFKTLTKNSVVIMGRKTFESIRKPLPDRCNFIISNKPSSNNDVYSFKNIPSAIKYAKETFPNLDIFVIGGASIYNQFLELDLIENIYQTVIDKIIEGDTFFSFDQDNWEIKESTKDGEVTYLNWKKK